MNTPDSYVDTDVIIRLLTGDDPKKQKASAVLFEKVAQGTITLICPDTIIADAVFVLSSPRLYNLPRTKIRDLLVPLVKLPNFKVDNKQTILRVLELYVQTGLDFGDAFLIASMQHSKKNSVYSYDHDFDKIPDIIRKEP